MLSISLAFSLPSGGVCLNSSLIDTSDHLFQNSLFSPRCSPLDNCKKESSKRIDSTFHLPSFDIFFAVSTSPHLHARTSFTSRYQVCMGSALSLLPLPRQHGHTKNSRSLWSVLPRAPFPAPIHRSLSGLPYLVSCSSFHLSLTGYLSLYIDHLFEPRSHAHTL